MVGRNKIFKIGEWCPDLADMTVVDKVTVARNVLPSGSGYEPMLSYNSITDALTARPRGAIHTRDDADAVFHYAGDATKLYRNVSDVWTDSSNGTYANAANDNWEFIRWYNTVIATNWADDPQTITLGGTTFSDLTTALKFRHVAVVRDFVVAGYTNDAVDGDVPWRVRWCGFQDPTSWTVSATTFADFEDLSQRKVQRVFGGEYGVILQDERITRMTFVGAPPVFQFDETVPGIGLLAPGAAIRVNDIIYFLSSRGWFSLSNGSQVQPIGVNRVDDTVLSDLDHTNLNRISMAHDPLTQRIFMGYPGQESVDGQPNKIVVYDYGRDRWSEVVQIHELLWEASSSSVSLEALDALYPSGVDSIPVSLDSPLFVGGVKQLAMFDSSKKSGFFTGAPMTGVIETGEWMFSSDQRTKVNGYRPLVEGDGPILTGRVGHRNDIASMVSYTDPRSPQTGGRIVTRTNARYHRFETTLAGQWDQMFGLMVDGKDQAPGGRRG